MYLQLAILTTAALTMTILLYGWYSAHKQAEFTASSIEQAAISLAQNISANSVEHLITGDLSALEALLLGSARFPGVISIQVTDRKGTALSYVVREDNGQARIHFSTDRLSVPTTISPKIQHLQDHMDVNYPVINKTLIGWVHIKSSLEPIAQLRANIWRDSTLAALIASLLASGVLLAFLRSPINALKDATEFADKLHRLRGNELKVYAGTEEISRLGHALNHASHKLFAQDEKLTASNQQLQSVLNNAIDAIITIDAQGKVNSFNPAAERIFGYPADEVIGHNVNMLMPEPFRSNHDDYIKRYLASEKANITGTRRELTGLHKDGTSFPMELGVSRMNIEGQTMFTGIVRDLTETKKIDMMKNEFISTVSHELRTPLTSIRGSLSLVASGQLGTLPEQVVPLVNIGLNNSDRLMHLINDILDIDKLESGELSLQFESLPIVSLLQQAIDDNQIYAEQYDVEFQFKPQVDDDARIYGDRQRLTQVVVNFLSNAAKFSHAGDTVELSVINEGNNLCISVSDHGTGIPEEFRGQIFQKFAQADSSDTRKKGGTGLGLYICMTIIKQHGGHIDYESEPGKGTRFFFELPQWIEKHEALESVS